MRRLNEIEAVRMLLHHARREFHALGMFEIKTLVDAVLSDHLWKDEFDEDILKVVRIVEYLPLAIAQAGALA